MKTKETFTQTFTETYTGKITSEIQSERDLHTAPPFKGERECLTLRHGLDSWRLATVVGIGGKTTK
jgi:hypothetical protein